MRKLDRRSSVGIVAVRCLALLLSTVHLAACSKSPKTVSWEEEVRLSSGKTLWVKRSDEFTPGSERGNPLKSVLMLRVRTYEFDWKGASHIYRTTPNESLGALLLHELADGSLVIVDSTRACAKPGYAEFRWEQGVWRLQPNLSPELIGQPRNLMAHYAADDSIPPRVTSQIKAAEDTAPRRARVALKLDASNVARDCSRRG